jgi:hypothetical protein
LEETRVTYDAPLLRSWFLPNAVSGPTVVLAMSHDIVDGESAVSWIRQNVDEKALPRNYWGELVHEFTVLYKMWTTMKLAPEIWKLD